MNHSLVSPPRIALVALCCAALAAAGPAVGAPRSDEPILLTSPEQVLATTAPAHLPTAEERAAYKAELDLRFARLREAGAKARAATRSFDMMGQRLERATLDADLGSSLLPWSAARTAGDGGPAPTNSNWNAYAGPWGLAQSAHLLKRTVIGANLHEMRDGVTNGMNATVATLVANRAQPAEPYSWVLEPFPDTSGWTQQQFDSLSTVYYTRFQLLRLWWSELIIEDPTSFREAMTLFWHDHFATAADKVYIPASMYKQLALLRTRSLGNVKALVQDIGNDPAMLVWLDGNYNIVGDVNENYSRELLELFTMGVGNYTQNDVREAARAFTGYTTSDGVHTVFIPSWHDYGSKTFMGQTGNWFGTHIVDIIFQQPETARFFVRKLYRYFLDEYPDETLVEDLAQTLRTNNWEIKPVLERMLKSERFYDPAYRGAIYKDGTDGILGTIRSLQLAGLDLSDPTSTQATYVFYGSSVTGQELFYPPNVGGWPGYRSWINSYTLPWRRYFSAVALAPGQYGWTLGLAFNPVVYASQTSNPNDAGTIVDEIALAHYGMAPTPLVRQALLDALLGGMAYNQWSINLPSASNHIRTFMRLLVKMADDQLK